MTIQKTYNALPSPKMGVLSADYLEQLAALVRKYDLPFLKITSAQRLAIAGHDPAILEELWRDLGQKSGPKKPVGIHYIQACPGVKWCKYGRQDSLALGEKLEKALGSMPLPAKTKVGISGCPMNCCEGYIRDVGIFGKNKGWSLIFGGNGGGVPRIGDIIGEGLTDTEVIELARKCLTFYAEQARSMERTGRLMTRTPLEKLKESLF